MYSILVFLTLTAVMALPLDDAGRVADDTAAATDADVNKATEEYFKHKPGRPGHGKGTISGFRPQGIAKLVSFNFPIILLSGNGGYNGGYGYPVSGPPTYPNTGVYPSLYQSGYYLAGYGYNPSNYYGYPGGFYGY